PVSFTYTVDDGQGQPNSTDTATVTGTVNPVNDAPIAVDDTATGTEDYVPVTGNVLSNDTDGEGDVDALPLTVTGFTVAGTVGTFAVDVPHVISNANGVVGTLTVGSDGSFSFAPAADYNSSAPPLGGGPVPVITYTVDDGTGGANATAVADLTITIDPVNDRPVVTVPATGFTAVPATTTDEDVALVFSTLAGNPVAVADLDGDAPLTVTLDVANGALTLLASAGATITDNGTASVTVSGTAAAINAALDGLSWTVPADWNGTDLLTVTADDGQGAANSVDVATAALEVRPVADANDDAVTVAEDGVASFNVLTGAGTDGGTSGAGVDTFEAGNGAPTGAVVTAVTQGTNGSVTFLADGSVSYTPVANYSGPDTFSYTVSTPDGQGGFITETATVTVTVTADNDAPVAGDDTFTTDEDTAATIVVGSNDTDTDGDPLTITEVDGQAITDGGPAVPVTNGSVQLVAGELIFTPAANYNGPISFTYTVDDGQGQPNSTDTATVTGTVTAVNDG
ncbi:MAG: Ig-like domain-containing protein, partial [Pseudomonadota bacterium]